MGRKNGEAKQETTQDKARRVNREILALLEREGCVIVAGEIGAVTGTFHQIAGLSWTVGVVKSEPPGE